MIYLRLSVFSLTYLICYVGSASLRQEIIDSLLNSDIYDKRIPPGIHFGELTEERPTNISVQLIITEIYDVNIDEMDFSVTWYLRQKWTDHRLQFNNSNIILQLDQEDINKVWTPDTVFLESKEGHLQKVTKSNTLMHVYHNGTVIYSLRLHTKLACSMDFHLYPLDIQKCKIHAESYGYTSEKLLYSWFEQEPVKIEHENIPLYDIPGRPPTTTKTCHVNFFPGATGFSCLEVTIELQRSIGYYMTEVFIPDILLVILSWVTFWLHPLAVPGRVSLGVVTVLTMSSQGAASRRSAPKVSYVKAIDVWTLFQIMFVFAAVIEFSVVNVLARIKVSEKTAVRIAKERASKYRESQGNAMDPDKDENRRPFLPKAKKIDFVSRIAFPAAYLFFNFLFWVIVTNV